VSLLECEYETRKELFLDQLIVSHTLFFWLLKVIDVHTFDKLCDMTGWERKALQRVAWPIKQLLLQYEINASNY